MPDSSQTTPWRLRPYRLMIYRGQDERCITSIDLTQEQAAAIGSMMGQAGDGIGCYELTGLAHFQMEPSDI